MSTPVLVCVCRPAKTIKQELSDLSLSIKIERASRRRVTLQCVRKSVSRPLIVSSHKPRHEPVLTHEFEL